MSIVRDIVIQQALEAVEDLPPEEQADALRDFGEALITQANAIQSEHSAATEPPAIFGQGRLFNAHIDEEVNYSNTYNEKELAELLGLTEQEIAAMTVQQVDDYTQGLRGTPEGGALEADLERHGDVRSSTLNISIV